MATIRKRDILVRSQDAINGTPNNFTVYVPGGSIQKMVKSNLRSFSIDGVALNVDSTNSSFYLSGGDPVPSIGPLTLNSVVLIGSTLIGVIYVSGDPAMNKRFVRSTDNGATWAYSTTATLGWGVNDYANLIITDGTTLLAFPTSLANKNPALSTDAGLTWTEWTTHPMTAIPNWIYFIAGFQEGNWIFVGNDGDYYVGTDYNTLTTYTLGGYTPTVGTQSIATLPSVSTTPVVFIACQEGLVQIYAYSAFHAVTPQWLSPQNNIVALQTAPDQYVMLMLTSNGITGSSAGSQIVTSGGNNLIFFVPITVATTTIDSGSIGAYQNGMLVAFAGSANTTPYQGIYSTDKGITWATFTDINLAGKDLFCALTISNSAVIVGIDNLDIGLEIGPSYPQLSQSNLSTTQVNMLPGVYNDATLCLMLQSVINAAWLTLPGTTGTFSCNVDSQGHLIIIQSLTDQWYISFFAAGQPLGFPATAALLGLPAQPPSHPSYSQYPPYYLAGASPLSILNVPFVMVQCSQLQNTINTSGQLYAWWLVPFNTSFNSQILIYDNQCPPDMRVLNAERDVNVLDIRLLDQYGDLLTFSNADVYLQIEIFYLSN